MKALVYTGVRQLEIQDMPHPTPGAGEVLIDIAHSGICGSDMHAYLGHDERRPAPLILGHEASGLVVSDNGADADADATEPRRRVAINPLVACGTCEHCVEGRDNLCLTRQIISMPPRHGAFAQALAMPKGNLVTMPAAVPLWHGALVEPMACGWHAVKMGLARVHNRTPDGVCAVVIGGGAIGVGAALSLAAMGVDDISIVEPNAVRRERLVGDLPQFRVLSHTDDAGNAATDLVVDAVGYAATRHAACALAKPGGVIAHIGLGEGRGGLDVRRLTLQEITFFGTYTYTAQDFRDTAQAIFDGKFGDFKWVDHRPLDQGAQAFDDLLNARVSAAKIVLDVG